jgi:hypothetical protein
LSQLELHPVSGLLGCPPALRRHAPVADPLGGTAAGESIVQALRRRQGGGLRLTGTVAEPLGRELGIDVSTLRVHADPEAGSIARSVQAEAFTYGNDIYFAPGSYQPSSGAGQRVLAHELSHVAAQRSGTDRGSRGPLTIGRADDPAEAAADRSADRVVGALRRSRHPGEPAAAGGGSNIDGEGVRTIRRLKGLTERQRSERSRMWAERIQPRVPGISLADARTMCDGLVDTSMSVNQAESLAQLVVDGWSASSVAAVGRKFVADNGGLVLAHWLRIAGQLPDQPENAAAFARVGSNWTPLGCVALAREFARNSGGARAIDWVRIARTGGPLLNQADDVAWFARMAGWSPVHKVNLAVAYGVAAVQRLAQHWAAIAIAAPGMADREAEVATFAQADPAWSAPSLVGLTTRFAADPGGRSAADWVALAGADPALVDQADAVAESARAGWTAAELSPVVVAALGANVAAAGTPPAAIDFDAFGGFTGGVFVG